MQTLHARLTGALVIVLTLALAALLVLSLRTSQLYQQEVQQQLNLGLAEHIVQEYPLIRAQQVNQDALEQLFQQLMVINPAIEVYLLDPTGSILAFQAPPGEVRRERVALGPVRMLLSGAERLPLLGDDPRDPRGTKVFSAAPIRHDGGLQGYLYVVLGGQAYDGVAGMLGRSYILRLGAWMGLGIALLGIAVALVLLRRFTRPLNRLAEEMQHFVVREIGPSEPMAPSAQGDEVARLQRTFNRMAGRIREQIALLERNDQLRRDLVASVSHDLRTPLTHLQGYLDTLLLKEGELSADDRAEYLRIAVSQSERLGQLVAELFELAKLDALQRPLNTEEFSIAELVDDVVSKARLSADERGIRLRALTRLRPRVVADPALIERAIENLLGNALRHTPAGGTVEIAVANRQGRVIVEVRDDGEGIDETDQGRIFEPFFRGGGESRTDGSSGLGLAIARRAVELHAGQLEVHSTPGHGTVFDFDLPGQGVSELTVATLVAES